MRISRTQMLIEKATDGSRGGEELPYTVTMGRLLPSLLFYRNHITDIIGHSRTS